MAWIVAALLFAAGVAGMFLIVRSGTGARRGGAAASFFTGLADGLDPARAMLVEEMEHEEHRRGEKKDDGE